jgi:hypothetical protein
MPLYYSPSSPPDVLKKEDIKRFMKDLSQELEGNFLVANMRHLVLYGRISLGRFSIARDCTKNYLHLTIESPPLPGEPTAVMTLQLSVDSKQLPPQSSSLSSSQSSPPLAAVVPAAVAAPALNNHTVSTTKSSMIAIALSVKSWIHDTAYLLWYGDSVTEYKDTDQKDKEVIQKIVNDFLTLLCMNSSVEEHPLAPIPMGSQGPIPVADTKDDRTSTYYCIFPSCLSPIINSNHFFLIANIFLFSY